MYTLNSYFTALLQAINPPQDRIDAALELPGQVRTYLEQHEEFTTVAPYSRLAGSYAQHMTVGDIKDVDFLVFIDGDPRKNNPEAKDVVRDLKRALNGLPAALGYDGHTAIDISRARRSVHVYFEERNFHLDVVPAIAPDGTDEPLYVPDRGWNEWIESDPLGYIQLISTLDGEYGGKVRRLGKLLKCFRDYQMKNRQPKSYWLGALLVDHIQRNDGLDMTQPLALLFRDLVDHVYADFEDLFEADTSETPTIADPMLGHDIAWNWERSHFETFMRRLDEARKWATKALDADDRETAIAYWQKIFGDTFPLFVDDKLAELATAAWPGTAAVRPSGLVVPIGSTSSGIATNVKETTFYGDNIT